MIPAAWRLQAKNESGVSVDVELKVQGWKVDGTGALVYGTLSADLGAAALASGAVHSTAEQSNATDLFLGLDVKVTLTFATAPAGNVIVYFQQRGEAAGEFPSDEEGYVVAVQKFTAAGTYHMSGQV